MLKIEEKRRRQAEGLYKIKANVLIWFGYELSV